MAPSTEQKQHHRKMCCMWNSLFNGDGDPSAFLSDKSDGTKTNSVDKSKVSKETYFYVEIARCNKMRNSVFCQTIINIITVSSQKGSVQVKTRKTINLQKQYQSEHIT